MHGSRPTPSARRSRLCRRPCRTCGKTSGGRSAATAILRERGGYIGQGRPSIQSTLLFRPRLPQVLAKIGLTSRGFGAVRPPPRHFVEGLRLSWPSQPATLLLPRDGIRDSALQAALGRYIAQIDPETDQRLSDFGANADENHLGAKQPRRQDNLNQPLRDLAIHDGDPCNIQEQVAGRRLLDGMECLVL